MFFHYKYSRFAILLLSLPFLLFSCKKGKDTPTLPPPVKVVVKEVASSEKGEGREYSGTVSSSETTTVSFVVAGTIIGLYAEEGQKVSKGQLLGRLRNGEYQNAYNIAQAQLAEAQDGYERLKKLHDANALPEVKWVEMEQKLKQAQNAAEIAQRTLNDANLHSPVAGTITRKFADVGQTVMPVEPVYEIVSTTSLTIDVAVSESEIGDFNIGEEARVSIISSDIKELPGKVKQKTVVADPLTRSYTVKVGIPNADGKILPGMTGNVTFDKKQTKEIDSETINLPSQAVLLNHDNRWFVWVVEDSVAHQRFVTADELSSDGILVTNGLKPGDKVIIEGMRKVGNGTRVDY